MCYYAKIMAAGAIVCLFETCIGPNFFIFSAKLFNTK